MNATASGHASVSGEIISKVAPYPLAFHIAAAAGTDPILWGATGYADEVFTVRLVGDSE